MEIQKRYPIEIGRPNRVVIELVGCGGTGSFLALHLARLAYHAREKHGLAVELAFIDPDRVEAGNIGRQNFCPAEIGEPKAWRLMHRYNAAFGLDIRAMVGRFEDSGTPCCPGGNAFCLIIGAVDNAAGRQAIHQAVERAKGKLWWLDCGNHEHSGQVLIGNKADVWTSTISPLGFCTAVPAPSVQHPELLEAEVVPPVVAGQSCAELAMAGIQGLMVNQAVAGWAASYVSRLVLSHDLATYATYFDLVSGSARSLPITNGNGRGDAA